MHADRTNRTALILLALVLIAGGAGVIALSTGLFGADLAQRPVADNVITRYVNEQGSWLWPVAAVAALIVLLLMLRWLVAILFSTDRAGDHDLPGDRSHGATTLAAGALTTAVGDEIDSYPGVQSTSARLIGDPAAPGLVLDVTVAADADLTAVRDRIENQAIDHARTAIDRPDLPATVNLTVSNRPLDRVR